MLEIALSCTHPVPVRVFSEILFPLPSGPEESSSLSRSFDADQCVSSEGFSVAFTPGFGEGVAEDSFLLILFLRFCSLHRKTPNNGTERRHQLGSEQGGSLNLCLYSPRCVAPAIEGRYSGETKELGVEIQVEAMNPVHSLTRTWVILVTLKPTDEDRIGTGRNNHES